MLAWRPYLCEVHQLVRDQIRIFQAVSPYKIPWPMVIRDRPGQSQLVRGIFPADAVCKYRQFISAGSWPPDS
jgi:hypothetical protein